MTEEKWMAELGRFYIIAMYIGRMLAEISCIMDEFIFFKHKRNYMQYVLNINFTGTVKENYELTEGSRQR